MGKIIKPKGMTIMSKAPWEAYPNPKKTTSVIPPKNNAGSNPKIPTSVSKWTTLPKTPNTSPNTGTNPDWDKDKPRVPIPPKTSTLSAYKKTPSTSPNTGSNPDWNKGKPRVTPVPKQMTLPKSQTIKTYQSTAAVRKPKTNPATPITPIKPKK